MAPRPEDETPSGEPIELHTGDVQPLADEPAPKTPEPAASARKPFDSEQTLPYPGKDRPAPDSDLTDPLGVDSQLALEPPAPAPLPAPLPQRLFDDQDPASTPGAMPVALAAAPRKLSEPPASDPAFLCVARGPGAGTSVAVPEGEHTIGRSPACFLAIAHDSLSREHALLKRASNRFWLRDAGSQFGTRVNGRRLDASLEIFAGDQIGIGDAVLFLRTGPVTDPLLTEPGIDYMIARRKRSPMMLWIGVAATAVASAALAAVLLTPFGERLFRGRPTPTESPAPTLAAAPSDVSLDGEIEIKRSDREPLVPLKPLSPTPTPAPQPPPRLSPSDAPEPAPHPHLNPTGAATEALRLFNDGQIDQAIVAGRNGGALSVAMKIWAFRKEMHSAQANLSFNDGAGAVRHYSAAATLDEELSRGWSKPGAQVRSELTRLLTLAAESALAQKNPAQACALLEKALSYSPGNAHAEELLKTAKAQKASGVAPSGEAAPPAKPKSARSAADQAFGE